MKKKGFTLIELLAVIVVLAIIALIATPIVMNTIKKSQKGAAERSAENYIDAVETAVATSRLDSEGVSDGTYTIDGNGDLTGTGLPNGKLTIEMSGNKPSSGTITIKNGQVTTDSKMTIGSYEVAYNPTNKKYEATEPYKGTLCTKASGVDLNNLVAGNEFTCELGDNDVKTFYVLETNEDNVSLIMNANVDSNGKALPASSVNQALVEWITEEDWKASGGVVTDEMKNDGGPCEIDDICISAEFGPITANNKLKDSTKTWTRMMPTQISLPTYAQISNLYENGILPVWLGTNLEEAVGGYWVSTTLDLYNVSFIWLTNPLALDSLHISNLETYGIRPVITVSKSNLS